MPTMRAMVAQTAGADLVLENREIPTPGPGRVLVKVHACGVCHSDMFAHEAAWPGISLPVVPGHEIAGEVAEIGADVEGWEVGQKVGVGWFGGNCGWCEQCRRGQFITCTHAEIPGVTIDGGYADYVVVRASALAAMPEGIKPEEAGPLLCAGITTFNALRNSETQGGGRVAVLGIGGLGHLAVQFAVRLGYETVAIARGTDKRELALKLGAHHYIDSTAGNPADALQELGGADLILATATSAEAMGSVFGGLRPHGKLLIVGASMDPVPVPAAALIGGETSIAGHASGTSIDSEDTLRFSALFGVHPMIETLPLEQANEAYEKMMSGDARFRMVLTTGLA
jgi:D-arabinose 1-dehydrogenase-like Zn-dependent alcohol dehydrogenase